MVDPEPGSAVAVAAAVRDGSLRAADALEQSLARIAAHDGRLSAFVEVFADTARAEANAIDRARAAGATLGPLAGVPVALKDNLLVAGRRAACGSRMLEHFVSPCTATVVERLRALGAIVLGRTNMDEFGMGSSTEHSAFFPTRNPWDEARVPGGSSGGAAVAVAADFCPLALGSDTGGSVRQPASLCGITGLKPTYGRLSRFGLVAYASSLDCVGVLARSAEDIAAALAIAGRDAADATSSEAPVPDYRALLQRGQGMAGLRIGVPRELQKGTDPGVANAVDAALRQCQELGARLVPCSLPSVAQAVPAYYLIAAAEASSNLARYDGVRYGLRAEGRTLDEVYERSRSRGFGPEVQLRVLLGTFALQQGYHDEAYGQASRVRTLVCRDFARAFAGCDVLASATSPVPAFVRGAMDADPVAMYRCDALTVPASLAGLPALSLPCGLLDGLPVGLQLTAPAWCEDRLLHAAHVFQGATDWHRRRPLQ